MADLEKIYNPLMEIYRRLNDNSVPFENLVLFALPVGATPADVLNAMRTVDNPDIGHEISDGVIYIQLETVTPREDSFAQRPFVWSGDDVMTHIRHQYYHNAPFELYEETWEDAMLRQIGMTHADCNKVLASIEHDAEQGVSWDTLVLYHANWLDNLWREQMAQTNAIGQPNPFNWDSIMNRAFNFMVLLALRCAPDVQKIENVVSHRLYYSVAVLLGEVYAIKVEFGGYVMPLMIALAHLSKVYNTHSVEGDIKVLDMFLNGNLDFEIRHFFATAELPENRSL